MCLHKFVKLVTSSVPVRKFYIDQMFVSVRMQCHNHVDTQTVKRVERAMQYYTISNLECCKCARMRFSLRKCSGGCADFRTLEGTLVTKGTARFDNNDCELKSQFRLLKFPEKIKIF